ncbi:MAG: 5-formyltetrahydrofolate cyclo-ligase [Raoultibacter sp.]
MNTKSNIRAQVLLRRKSIAATERHRKTAEVCQRLEKILETPFPSEILHKKDRKAFVSSPPDASSSSYLIAVYSAMGSELSLDPFIGAAYRCGMRLSFPCMIGTPCHTPCERNLSMEFREVTQRDYEKGKAPFVVHPLRSYDANSAELQAFPRVSAQDIEVVIVPLVAFDEHKNRLGYGGGNYDRFLPHLAPGARTIGVAFSEQRVNHLPLEDHDRALDEILFA